LTKVNDAFTVFQTMKLHYLYKGLGSGRIALATYLA